MHSLTRSAAAIAAALMLATIPAGAADNHTVDVELAWDAPGAGSYTYNVYRDGDWIGSTTQTTYTDAMPVDATTGVGVSHYEITVVPQNGQSRTPNGTQEGPVHDAIVLALRLAFCQYFTTITDPNEVPPVGVSYNEECGPL